MEVAVRSIPTQSERGTIWSHPEEGPEAPRHWEAREAVGRPQLRLGFGADRF